MRSRSVRSVFPSLTLLGGVLVSTTLGLVGGALVLAPSNHARSLQVMLFAAAVWVTTSVTALALQWFVGDPLRRIFRVVCRLTEGDFTVRTDVTGAGLMAQIVAALNDLSGVLEARYAATQASERRYRRLYEHSPAGLFRTRPDGRVLDCNMAAVRMLGYDSVVDVKTRNASTYYADARDRDDVLKRLAHEPVISNLRLKFRGKDGREFPVLLTVIRSDEGGEVSLEGQFVDASGIERHATLPVELQPT